MVETKTVAERLREAESLCETHGMCRVVLHAINGEATCPPIASCVDCKIGILRTLARQIEAEQRSKTEQNGVDVDALLKLVDKLNIYTQCGKRNGNVSVPFSLMNKWADIIRNAVKGAKPQLPEGIEWPRFEDGELVEFGDKIQHDGEAKKVSKVSFYKTRTWIRVATETYYEDCEYLPNEPVKRPEPEVLDADGVPIKVGDTVWHEDEGECVVERIYRQNGDTLLDLDVCGAVWNTANVKPAEVTHRKPDTQEAIDADCWVDAKDYCEKYGVKTEWPKHYGKAKCEHLLARQRKLTQGTDPFVSWAKTAYTCNKCGADNTPTYRVRTSGGE